MQAESQTAKSSQKSRKPNREKLTEEQKAKPRKAHRRAENF
jgi:hypothetical protein